MRPLRYSINVTLDGCCDHQGMAPDEAMHRHAAEGTFALLAGLMASAHGRRVVPVCRRWERLPFPGCHGQIAALTVALAG